MIERLVASECASKPSDFWNMSNVELRSFYEKTAPIRERKRQMIQRAIRREQRIKKQKEDIQRLWEWSCDRIKRTGLPKDDYPFPSREIAAWLIKIKEGLREENAHLS